MWALDVSQMLCVLYVNVFASACVCVCACTCGPVNTSHSFSWKRTSCTRHSLRTFRRCSIKQVWRAGCWRGSWKSWQTAWRRRRLSSARCFLPPMWTKLPLVKSQTKLRYCWSSPFVCLFVFSHSHPCTLNHWCFYVCVLCTSFCCLCLNIKETCFCLQENLDSSNNSIKNVQYKKARISKVSSSFTSWKCGPASVFVVYLCINIHIMWKNCASGRPARICCWRTKQSKGLLVSLWRSFV